MSDGAYRGTVVAVCNNNGRDKDKKQQHDDAQHNKAPQIRLGEFDMILLDVADWPGSPLTCNFNPAESADLALRTFLMAEVRKFIDRHDLTQVKAAKFFGTGQPKISNIINGKVEEISSDYLVGLLAKTCGEFRYSFKQPTERQAEARLGA